MNTLVSSARVGDKMYDAHVATIDSTFIGFEDHGIFSATLDFVFSGSGQGFGMMSMPEWFTNTFIQGMLRTVGVEQWEHLKGKRVWILRGKESRMVEGIMNINNTEKVFIVQEEWAKAKEKSTSGSVSK